MTSSNPVAADEHDTPETLFEGTLQFRSEAQPLDIGVFLVGDSETIEVFASTTEARRQLGELESHPRGLQARIYGTITDNALVATSIELWDGASINLGSALLGLYEEVRSEPQTRRPPRRERGSWIHPEIDGRVLQQFELSLSRHGAQAALYDEESGSVWFRTIDFSTGCSAVTRGPFTVSKREKRGNGITAL